MRKLFVVNGLPGVGKNLFGKMVGDELSKRGVGFSHLSTVDLVKHLLLPISMWDPGFVERQHWGMLFDLKRRVTELDWDGVTKDKYWRRVMSEYKREITEYDPGYINFWVIERALNMPEPSVSFVDIREPENIDAFIEKARDVFGVEVRTILVMGDVCAEYDNTSDGRVLEYEYDIVVDNKRAGIGVEETLEKLRCEAGRFVEKEVRLFQVYRKEIERGV